MGNQLDKSIQQQLDNLGKGSYSERQQALESLQPHVHQVVDQLLTIATSNAHPQASEAIKLLRLCEDERRFAVFKQMVTSNNVIIGQAALYGIATIDPLPIQFLIESLPNMQRLVLPHCIQLLGKHYDADVRKLLLNYLQTTEEPVIKYTIINILGDVNDTQSIPLIEAHLTHENHHVRSYAEAALSKLNR